MYGAEGSFWALQDPFADSDSDRGYPKGAAKQAAPADPFADSDHETSETGNWAEMGV